MNKLAYITETMYSYPESNHPISCNDDCELEGKGGMTELTLIVPGFVDARPYTKDGFIFEDLFPGKVIVKCRHCGQWAARKTACGYCGAPVD
jgi:hypothetical protein